MFFFFFWSLYFTFIYVIFFFFTVIFYLLSTSLDTSFFFLLFLHVPLAWCGVLLYFFLLVSCLCFFYFKHIAWLFLCFILCILGFFFSGLILWTGSCWALPVWGSFFVLDSRVFSILILSIIFLGSFCLLLGAFWGKITYTRVLFIILLSSLNFPIIKLSVYWWATLHQVSSVLANSLFIHGILYFPLVLCFFMLCFFLVIMGCILFIFFYELFF